MPRFYFHLRANGRIHHDPEGSECADLAGARVHALDMANELMRNNVPKTRLWSLCVVDGHGRAAFDLFFADLAARRERRPAALEALSAVTCRRLGALIDVRCAVRDTVRESGLLLARSTGKPKLVFARSRLPT